MRAPARAPVRSARPSSLDAVGFVVIGDLVNAACCEALIDVVESHRDTIAPRRWLDVGAVRRLAQELAGDPRIAALLAPGAAPVLCTLFDKGEGRDWPVGPHQDLAVPASCFTADELAGMATSTRDGLAFVQPPPDFLASVLAVRVQLDDVPGDAGALEVVPGSHARGRLSAAQLASIGGHRLRVGVPRGGALLMRPLLVHASRRLQAPVRRRVLHFLFAPGSRTA